MFLLTVKKSIQESLIIPRIVRTTMKSHGDARTD